MFQIKYVIYFLSILIFIHFILYFFNIDIFDLFEKSSNINSVINKSENNIDTDIVELENSLQQLKDLTNN